MFINSSFFQNNTSLAVAILLTFIVVKSIAKHKLNVPYFTDTTCAMVFSWIQLAVKNYTGYVLCRTLRTEFIQSIMLFALYEIMPIIFRTVSLLHVLMLYNVPYTDSHFMGIAYISIYTMPYKLLILWVCNYRYKQWLFYATPPPYKKDIVNIIGCLLWVASGVVLFHKPEGVSCLIFELVECLTGGNMAAYINYKYILYYHMDAFRFCKDIAALEVWTTWLSKVDQNYAPLSN